jgi:RHS repeat-associated protein
VTAKGVAIAGTAVKHDGLQTSEARMLGIASEERMSLFAYDARSRLAASIFGAKNAIDPTAPTPGSSREKVNAADYRNAQERTKILKPLSGVDSSQIDPPTATFDEKGGGGHKIGKVTRDFQVRPFGWNGAERIDDGRFVYTFDARGRLIRATEKSTLTPVRRALYTYTGAGRLVGRRVEYANVANPASGDWKLEDRAQILTDDGLPAETTFAWDPVTDRLLAVYRAGATNAPLKQIIHGQSAYDDPLETTTIDPVTGAVIRLYPIYDEAAAGSPQTVLDSRAEVVARNLTNDPYGAYQLALTGPAIDGAAIRARRNAAGAITAIEVELHATEQLAPATLPTGVRLATLTPSRAVVRLASVTPTLAPDAYTIRWTLTQAEWETLTAPPATTLSIAATGHLRASTWSEVPFMPAPDWAQASGRVLSSPDYPVEVLDEISSLAGSLAAIPNGEERTTELYAVPTLALLGVSARGTALDGVLSAGFQALPFAEGMTGLIYARARWYDPSTGSFLSPDPLGYQDSSNLYAFAGGDPVNGRDPTGSVIVLTPGSFRKAWHTGKAALKEAGATVKNVAIGIRDAAVVYASALYNPKPTLDAVPQLVEDLQDPLLGRSPDDRYMRLKAIEADAQIDTFSGSNKAEQQQMIGSGMVHTVAVLAPAAKGFGIGSAEIVAPVPMWQDYLPAARQRSAATRVGLRLPDEIAEDLVGMAVHRDIFFAAHPELRGKVWVHHAIEKQAITKHYPGLFAEDEIEVLTNYRGIPTSINSEIHLSKIRMEWNEFYRTHPWATREQVLEKVVDIDLRYGRLFSPSRE